MEVGFLEDRRDGVVEWSCEKPRVLGCSAKNRSLVLIQSVVVIAVSAANGAP